MAMTRYAAGTEITRTKELEKKEIFVRHARSTFLPSLMSKNVDPVSSLDFPNFINLFKHIVFQFDVSFCVTLHIHCLNCKDDDRKISRIS